MPVEEPPYRRLAQAADSLLRPLARPEDDILCARLRLLLQLPRFQPTEMPASAAMQAEAIRVLDTIREAQLPYSRWRHAPPASAFTPAQELRVLSAASHVQPVAADLATTIHTRFHYIGTVRQGLHFGLYDREEDEVPCTLLTFSPFDLVPLTGFLPEGVTPGEVCVLSRAYSFRWAPRNSFSFAFRRALVVLRRALPELRLMLTYVNPNLGFSGASYAASNWAPFAQEATLYHYLDGQYITWRELERRFSCVDPSLLTGMLGERLTRSAMPLEPLRLLEFSLNEPAHRRAESVGRTGGE